ncbi:hypothetical protein [Bradyrhizobium sp. USDA 4452]
MIEVAQSAFRPPQRSFTEIDRDEIVRQTLKEVERRIGELSVNATYRQAHKQVVRILHGMKP